MGDSKTAAAHLTNDQRAKALALLERGVQFVNEPIDPQYPGGAGRWLIADVRPLSEPEIDRLLAWWNSDPEVLLTGSLLQVAAAAADAIGLEAKVRVVPVEVAQKSLSHVLEMRRQAKAHLSNFAADCPEGSTGHRLFVEAKQSFEEINALATALTPEEAKTP